MIDMEDRILSLEAELLRMEELEERIRVLESILCAFKDTVEYGMQQI
jgi:hypothetical protein